MGEEPINLSIDDAMNAMLGGGLRAHPQECRALVCCARQQGQVGMSACSPFCLLSTLVYQHLPLFLHVGFGISTKCHEPQKTERNSTVPWAWTLSTSEVWGASPRPQSLCTACDRRVAHLLGCSQSGAKSDPTQDFLNPLRDPWPQGTLDAHLLHVRCWVRRGTQLPLPPPGLYQGVHQQQPDEMGPP